MKNRKRIYYLYYMISVISLTITIVSCSKSAERHYTQEESEKIDSLLSEKRSITVLQKLHLKYEKDNNRLGMAVTLRKIGVCYREDSCNFAKAIEIHRTALALSEQICDTIGTIRALNDIGTNFRRLGILDEASAYHYKALALCGQFSDKKSFAARKNRVVTLNGIGNVYLTLKDYVTAKKIFSQALQGERQLNSPLGEAINYANIGSILESENNIIEARRYFALSMQKNQEAKSDLGIALCHISFGRLYEKEKDMKKALAEYQSAYTLLNKAGDSWHWLEACSAIARVFISQGEIDSAEHVLKLARQTALKIKSLEHIGTTYHLFSQLYNKQGDYKKALDCYRLSQVYGDSVNSSKNMNELQNVRMKYERERRQDEIDLIRKNYESEQKVKNAFIATAVTILMLSIVIIYFLWYTLRIRAKSQKVMRNMEKMRADFYTNITHEFRTPLTVIIGLGHHLENGVLAKGETIQNIGSIIARQGNSLFTLINQLLDISKIQSAIGQPDWRRGDIVAYIHMIIENYEGYAMYRNITLDFMPKETMVEMDFIPDYIDKIMANLLSNAIKFTPDYGRIIVRTNMRNSLFSISVNDNGKGICDRDLPHIFEAFYQGSGGRANIGTGIGLNLVSQIVKSIGGNVMVESEQYKGTTFTVTLPKSSVHDKLEKWNDSKECHVAEEEDTTDSLENGYADSNNKKPDAPNILIVEDNNDVSYFISTQLHDQYNLYYARNGKTGLEKAKALVPELIITDVMMPEMDGYELCKAIRSSELLNHIPVIMVTAKTDDKDRLKGLSCGADAYLNKPFNTDELNLRVIKLLNMRSTLREKYSLALRSDTTEQLSLSANDKKFISKLVDAIYEKMKSCETDVDSISTAMYMSRSQLQRKIFAITGQSASAYINTIRMKRAKRLLANGDIPIGEVATKCGYAEISHFSRAFKQEFDLTPSQFKKQ